MIENGQTVSVHYVGTFDDGTEFDNSRSRGQALSIQVGVGQVIPGFDQALTEMSVGETKSVSLTPEQAYGQSNPDAVQVVGRDNFPPEMELMEGLTVQGQGPQGPVLATIIVADETNVTIDLNHPLAGKNLNFEIELISIS